MKWCSSLLFTVFLPLHFGRSFQRSSRLSVPLPWGCSSLPPSLHFLSPWSDLVPGFSCCHCCCRWPSTATIFHQNTKPQWSIQAQARSITAPPSHPTLFWLCLLFDFLTPCKWNGPVQEESLAQTVTARSEELNELRKTYWFLNTVCRFIVSLSLMYYQENVFKVLQQRKAFISCLLI